MDEYWRVSTVHQADGKDVIVLKIRGGSIELTIHDQDTVERLVSDLTHAANNAMWRKPDNGKRTK